MTKQRVIVIAMCLGVFLTLIDTTIMNIALSNIQKDLNTNLTSMNWALNIYSLIFAAFAIPLGRFAGRIGLYRSYILGSLIFLLGSLITGFAGNITVLVSGRIVLAVGAAVILPLSMAIAYSTADTVEKRSPIVAMVAMTQGLAGAIGPSIGGAFTQYLTWRWAFFVNIPVVMLIMGMCFYTLKFKSEPKNNQKNDIIGSILCSVSLFTLTLSLIEGNAWQWTSPAIVSLFIVSSVSLITFIIYEGKISHSMIPMELFKSRQFNGAALTMVISTVYFVGVFIIIPTYFIKILNREELFASFLLMIVSLTLSVFSPLASKLVIKVGARLTIFSGFILMTAAYGTFAMLEADNMWTIYIACALLGAGYGLLLGPVQVLGASDFSGEMLTASQSVLFVFRQIGLVLAFAIFLSIFNSNIESIGIVYTNITAFTSIYQGAIILVILSSLVIFLFKKEGEA